MADRPYQFVGPMLKAMASLADDLGTNIMFTQKAPLYNLLLEVICLQAMTLKILQDLNPTVVTDAALQARLNTAIDTGPNGDRSGWPGWIVLQVAPENLAMYGATEADSVSSLQAKMDAYNASRR